MADEDKRVHFIKDSLVMHKHSKSQEWLNWGIRVVMAKNYIDNLREQAMKGWAEKLAQGWLPSSPPPGYMTVTENGKRIHVPNPKTTSPMQQVFRKYLEPGESCVSIGQEMFRLGIRTRMGHPYGKTQVQRILTNPFYIGINHFNGKDYPGAQKPIIDRELFEKVQQKMHRGRPQSYGKHYSPLQGLIHCEDCGSVVIWQLQKGRYYGVCRRLTEACKQAKMLREDNVEALIVGQLRELVCPSPEIIDWVISEMHAQHETDIQQREQIRASLESELKRIKTMDERLYDDKLAGDITNERYEVKHGAFMTKRKELQRQIEDLDSSLSARLEQRVALLELSQKAAEIYVHKPAAQKRLIISKLFAKLTLKQGALSVTPTKFVETIASRVQKTRNITEV